MNESKEDIIITLKNTIEDLESENEKLELESKIFQRAKDRYFKKMKDLQKELIYLKHQNIKKEKVKRILKEADE